MDNEKVKSLNEFKLSIVESLLKQVKREASKRGHPSILVEAIYSAKKKYQQLQYKTNPLEKIDVTTGQNLMRRKDDVNVLDGLGSLKWNALNVTFVYVLHQHQIVLESFMIHNL